MDKALELMPAASSAFMMSAEPLLHCPQPGRRQPDTHIRAHALTHTQRASALRRDLQHKGPRLRRDLQHGVA